MKAANAETAGSSAYPLSDDDQDDRDDDGDHGNDDHDENNNDDNDKKRRQELPRSQGRRRSGDSALDGSQSLGRYRRQERGGRDRVSVMQDIIRSKDRWGELSSIPGSCLPASQGTCAVRYAVVGEYMVPCVVSSRRERPFHPP